MPPPEVRSTPDPDPVNPHMGDNRKLTADSRSAPMFASHHRAVISSSSSPAERPQRLSVLRMATPALRDEWQHNPLRRGTQTASSACFAAPDEA